MPVDVITPDELDKKIELLESKFEKKMRKIILEELPKVLEEKGFLTKESLSKAVLKA